MSDLQNRFWSKVDQSADCWEWIAHRNKKNYGVFNREGTTTLAHRYSAELAGMDIIDKLVCHNCDNPSCVNPDHLFVGTNQDNMDDMASKGRRSTTGHKQTSMPKLRKLTAEQVLYVRASDKPLRALARELSVGSTTIFKIKHNLKYKELV